MIKNRLSVLLAERGLKITRVANDTGISRNTITATAQNNSEMIRLETINTLCKYLNVTPGDFFIFEPIDIKFSMFATPIKLGLNRNETRIEFKENIFDLYMDISGASSLKTVELNCSISLDHTEFDIVQFGDRLIKFNVEFDNDEEKEIFLSTIYNKIDTSFHKDIYEDLSSTIKQSFAEELKKTFEEVIDKYLDPFSDTVIINNLLSGADDFKMIIDSSVFLPF